jgi:L-fuconolactonase
MTNDGPTSSFVDAHHHIWTIARGDYAWITPSQPVLDRDYDLADYRAIAPQGIAASVLVQAAPTVAETRFLLDAARAAGDRVLAVVGWIDFEADDALDTLHDLAHDTRLRSIRPMVQNIADPDWLLRPRVQAVLAKLPLLDLAFDALVKPPQLPALVRMLERNPDLRVVIDHAAKPLIAAGVTEPWTSLMRAAADHPHVHCKLSGLVTEAAADWTLDSLRPYVEHVVTCFGAGRLMWGSDWPVVELNGGMSRWWSATQALLGPLGPGGRAAILGGNARRFYRR